MTIWDEIRRKSADRKVRAVMAGKHLYTAHVTTKGETANWDTLPDDCKQRWADKGRAFV